MKHCLVTGGAGFIGSHVTEALLQRGDHVTVVDDESTGSRRNLEAVIGRPELRYFKASVADHNVMRDLLGEADEVYHLAAAVGVQLIAHAPVHTIETNIGPTGWILAELARRNAEGRPAPFFLASSSEVYGKNPRPVWNEEDDIVLGPTHRARWAYGASKAIDEFLALGYHAGQGLPVVVARLFNVVGPRQSGAYGMVLPRFVEAALSGRAPVVYDDGRQVRSFVHVADVVAAILKLMETPGTAGRVFNIGSDRPTTILELAEKVIQAVDPTLNVEFRSYVEAFGKDFEDCRRRVPDLSRLRSTIDFRLRYDLDAIIGQTVEWWRTKGPDAEDS